MLKISDSFGKIVSLKHPIKTDITICINKYYFILFIIIQSKTLQLRSITYM